MCPKLGWFTLLHSNFDIFPFVSVETESYLNGLTSDVTPVVVRSTLDQVTERSQQLQKELADSAHILSKYNLKSAQGVSAGAQDCGTVSCALWN